MQDQEDKSTKKGIVRTIGEKTKIELKPIVDIDAWYADELSQVFPRNELKILENIKALIAGRRHLPLADKTCGRLLSCRSADDGDHVVTPPVSKNLIVSNTSNFLQISA